MKKYILVWLMLFLPMGNIAAFDNTLDSVPKEVVLDSIIVKSNYRHAKRCGNKYKISFKGSPFYKEKSLAEAMTICPLITKNNHSFSVLGKSATAVYINGRPAMLSGEDLYAFLDSKTAQEIDHIEIQANPTAEYQADLKTAIINIVLSNKVKPGWMSVTAAEATKGKKCGIKGSELLAYNLRNMSVNLFLNGMHSKKSTVSQHNYHSLYDNDFEEKSIMSKTGTPYSLMYSMSWKTKQMELGIDYSLSSLRVDETGGQLYNGTKILDKDDKIRNQNHNIQVFNSYQWNKTGIDLVYNLYFRKNRENSDFFSTSDTVLQRDNEHFVHNALKIDLSSRIDSTLTMSYGVSGNIQRVHTGYRYADIEHSAIYREHTLGAYLGGQKETGNWFFYLGLRYEYTRQQYIENGETYHNLFPNISVNYNMESASVYFNYARSIERMPFSNLIVTPAYFSPNSMTVGNPALRPTILNDVQLGMSYSNWDLELFAKAITDGILEYTCQNHGTNVNTYTNIDREHQIGLNMSYMWHVNRQVLLKLMGSSYYDVARLGQGNKQKSWNNYLSSNMTIRLDQAGIFDANVNYWALFPQKENGLYWKNRGNLSVTFNCNLLQKHLKLSLTANDIFNQDRARYRRCYSGVTVDTKNTFDKRYVSLAMKYTLGNNEKVRKNKHHNLKDLNRIPTE